MVASPAVSGARPWRIGLIGLAAVVALFGVGFAWFAFDARRAEPGPKLADGIVVLTGGAGRLELGLRLLAERRGELLLISGAGPGNLADLLSAAGLTANRAAATAPGRVTLGRGARSTRGNARETAEWAAAHGLRSLIVVTSGYHMRRAQLELRRALPADVALHPVPLLPHADDGHDRVPLRLLASEFAKWLGASVGLSAWVTREEEAGAPP